MYRFTEAWTWKIALVVKIKMWFFDVHQMMKLVEWAKIPFALLIMETSPCEVDLIKPALIRGKMRFDEVKKKKKKKKTLMRVTVVFSSHQF